MSVIAPRVFIGTLHSNEGDFVKCCEAIKSQTNVVVTHHVVSGQNEKDAHNALWDAWRKHREDHDLFVKVDADTVLCQPWIISEICAVFRNDPTVTGLQAPLHDYMTDGLINGLNAYSPHVRFLETSDRLYCDRNIVDGNDHIVCGTSLPPTLCVVGYHCHHATGLQGFRYGVHRAMKTQNHEVQRLIWAWRRHNDRVRGLGVIGSLMAPKLTRLGAADYTDSELHAAYMETEHRYDEFVAAINDRQFNVFD